MTDGEILEEFAGPGGWSEALRRRGRSGLGVEKNAAACATASAAGHRRVRSDVALLDFRTFAKRYVGVISSPPCQGFSPAGNGAGRYDAELLIAGAAELGAGVDPRPALHAQMIDDRSVLALEPLRAVLELRPDWTCWEQVPAVLPLWEACAIVLREKGYDAEATVVYAEQYGVAQTRKRAILRAHINGLRPLIPTHSRFYPHDPERLDPHVRRWVSMAEALDGRPGDVLRSNYGTGGDPAARGERTVDQPAFTVTSKVGRNRWLFAGAGATAHVTIEQAGILQSFRADYPWHGRRTDRYQQVGDAVPPLLGDAVLDSLGVAAEREDAA